MTGVFAPVFFVSTQLTRVRTELRFAAADPWNGNRPCAFTLDSYVLTLRGVKSVPENTSPPAGGFHRALRSDADEVARFLPESLIELWLTKQVSVEALPALLKQMEPSLKQSDYKPILRSLGMKIFGIFEATCCSLLVIIAVIAVAAAHAPFWLAAAVVLGTASVCWLFFYQVYFALLLRRKQQTKWLLERIHLASKKETPRMTTTPHQPNPLDTVIHSIKLDQAAKQRAPHHVRFDAIMDVPEVLEPSMERRLRNAFPELKWEDHAENWGKVCIWGTSPETPDSAVISIVRREPPGPFKLGITVSALIDSGAEKSLNEFIDRLQRALSGWSISNLPKFKTRPPSGISIDQQETVQLVFPIERPQIKLMAPGADIILSRNLLEALSAHDPGGNDEESRLAGMRGARARAILDKAAGHLQVQLALVRGGEYLVGELLELGQAEVILSGTPPISPPRIQVRYFGTRMAPTVGFGYISYSAAKGEFLRLNWWVS